MRVFVTGATGFVGSAVVRELVSHGHEILGFVRSNEGAAQVQAMGATAQIGDIANIDGLRAGVLASDAVVHTAFGHDFSKFAENCELDRRVIEAMGDAAQGSPRKLIITSAIGILPMTVRTTEDSNPTPIAQYNPRAATEEAVQSVAARGVHTSIVRLASSVHGEGDHAFVPMLIDIAKKTGVSAYVGEGQNHWPAVHQLDAATLYRLALERGTAGSRYHAVAEERIPFRDIANAIGRGLGVPVVSKSVADAEAHFGWFANFVGFDLNPSSQLTQERLGWSPIMPTLLSDLERGAYFKT